MCSNMDGPRDYHIKLRYRETNVTWFHLYVESQEMTQMKQTDRHMKQTCLPKRGDGR